VADDLSKRRKVGDVYRSGSYKKAQKRGYKTAGLSNEKFKKATTLKGQKLTAAQRAKVGELKKIGETRWEKGKGVVGPGGKAFTGTVQLASGKTASYFRGRRVGYKAASAAPKAGTRTGPKGPPRRIPMTRVTPQQRGEGGVRGMGSLTREQQAAASRLTGQAKAIQAGKPTAKPTATSQGRVPRGLPSGRGLPAGTTKTIGGVRYKWTGGSWQRIRR
jgi:hypothetical protein